MSASLQPRRYYPRWGTQDPSTPASPLTYRKPPEQQQHQQQHPQHQQQDGSVPDNNGPPTPPTPTSPAMAAVASQAEAGGGGEGGSGAGGDGEGEQKTPKAGSRRKRFNGLLADRFQHPFDLVRGRVVAAGMPGVVLEIGVFRRPRFFAVGCVWSGRQVAFVERNPQKVGSFAEGFRFCRWRGVGGEEEGGERGKGERRGRGETQTGFETICTLNLLKRTCCRVYSGERRDDQSGRCILARERILFFPFCFFRRPPGCSAGSPGWSWRSAERCRP